MQQTHHSEMRFETLGYIPHLLTALNGLVYFLIIGEPRGDNLMVGSIFGELLTELGIRIEDAECNLVGEMLKIVSMIRKYHNHKPQTTLWHREEEPLNHHETPGRQIKQSNKHKPGMLIIFNQCSFLAL